MTLQYIGANLYLNTAYWHFVKWILKHMPWIRQIRHFILKKKKIDIHDYLQNIISKGVVYDKIALTIFTWMYHIQICVLLNGQHWSTQDIPTPTDAHIYLCYLGKMVFQDTRLKTLQKKLLWSQIFSLICGGGAFLPSHNQCEVQWCMKYQCMKLRHVPRYEPSISPKGRNRGGRLFGRFACLELLPVEYSSLSF